MLHFRTPKYGTWLWPGILWQDVPNPSKLKRTEGSLAAKLGSNAKFLPSANQAPIIVRCTEMCSDVPKWSKMCQRHKLRKPSPGTTCESSPQDLRAVPFFLVVGCWWLLHWDAGSIGFRSSRSDMQWHALYCPVLPLHIPKGSSQLVPRGGQTIEVFAACQLDLKKIDRQSFCLLGLTVGTNRERTVGMPPDCYPQLRKGFSECRTVFRFCSAERPPTTSARWYLCYHEKLNLPTKANPDPRRIYANMANVCKCQVFIPIEYNVCMNCMLFMSFCRTEGRRPCRCSGLAQWQSPWRPTRSSG